MKDKPKAQVGLFWILLLYGFSLSLFGAGCHNYNIRKANKHITRITAKELLSKPPEEPRWVEIGGQPISGSLAEADDARMIAFADLDGASAVAVRMAKDSPLPTATNSTVVRGLTVLRSQNDKPLPKFSIPPGCRMAANLVIQENDLPPGWLSSWGPMIIGAFLFMAMSNAFEEWWKKR